MTIRTILKIAPASHNDIEARIRTLGPDYNNCFQHHAKYGLLIVLDRSEVALAADDQTKEVFTWPPSG